MRRLIEASHLDLCCLQKPIFIACGSERVNDVSFLVGHFVSSPREREKRDKELEEARKEAFPGVGVGKQGICLFIFREQRNIGNYFK